MLDLGPDPLGVFTPLSRWPFVCGLRMGIIQWQKTSFELKGELTNLHTLRESNIAGWNMDRIEDVFPFKNWGYYIAMFVYQRVTSALGMYYLSCKPPWTENSCDFE